MTENNELNLVISDEESANGLTGRSFQNTLSQQGSPSGQFVRTNGGGIHIGSFPQNAMSSSGLKDTIPSYDRDFASNTAPQGYYYGDTITGPKPTLESMSSSHTAFNFDSAGNQQAQPVRRTTKDSYEPNTIESVPYGRDGYGENLSAPTFPSDDEIKRYANKGRLSYNGPGQFGGTAGAYGNDELFNDQEDQRDMYELEDRKTQSLKDSQLAGRVRYSKMTEEEAAIAFENRKKELFSNYLKKESKKSPTGSRARTPGSTCLLSKDLIFKDERSNQRGFTSPDEELFGKVSTTNFVVTNDYAHNQAKSNNRGKSKTPIAKRRPSIEKKDVPAPAAKAILAKQRRDSPMAKNKPQPVSQKQPQQQSKQRPVNAPSQPKTEQSHTVNVGLKRPAGKAKNEENMGAHENSYNQGNNYEKNRKLTPADNIGKPDYDSNNTGSNMYTSSKGTFRTQEILNDIHNLEEEILRLESESSRGFNSKDNYTRSEPQEEQQYQITAKFAGSYGQKHREKEVESKKRNNSREKNKSEGFQRQNSFERKTHSKERNIPDKNGARHSNVSQASIKDQISQTYNALNEKEFEHHHDYLYERALVQKNSREFLRERSREMRENQELAQCTFAPQIKHRPEMKLEDIVIRTRKWQLEREEQFLRNEKDKVHKELRDCTFYPNGMLDRGRKLEFNSNDFYKKNIEWQKRKEAEDVRKQNENHKSIMQSGKRRSRSSVSVSRLHDSNILPDEKPTEKSRLGRSASNKSLRSVGPAERSNSCRKRDESGKRHHNSFCKACTSNATQDRKSYKSQKGEENRQSTTNQSVLGNKDMNIQPTILESYAIIDGLQQIVHAKEKENQQKVIQQKEDAIKKLKTISANQPKTNKSDQRRNNLRSRLPPSPSQPQLQGKIAITSSNFDTDSLQDATQMLTVRNNRYYLEEKPQEKMQTGASRGRSNSRDSKNRTMTPTKAYETNKSIRENSYTKAAQLAKTRKESPFRSKQPSKFFENSMSKNSYSDFMASPFQSFMASPQNFGQFTSVHSQKSELNYVAKGLTSPNTQTLEKKYLSLLDQVSRVTKQLDQINVENNDLQNDISTMRRRQLNKSSSFYSSK